VACCSQQCSTKCFCSPQKIHKVCLTENYLVKTLSSQCQSHVIHGHCAHGNIVHEQRSCDEFDCSVCYGTATEPRSITQDVLLQHIARWYFDCFRKKTWKLCRLATLPTARTRSQRHLSLNTSSTASRGTGNQDLLR